MPRTSNEQAPRPEENPEVVVTVELVAAELSDLCDRYTHATTGEIESPNALLSRAYSLLDGSDISPSAKADLILQTEEFISTHATTGTQALNKKITREYLPKLLGPETFQEMSHEIGKLLRDAKEIPKGALGEVLKQAEIEEGEGDSEKEEAPVIDLLPEEIMVEQLPVLESMSPAIRTVVINRLVASNLILEKDGSYHFPKKKSAQKYLLSGSLEVAEGWQQAKKRASENTTVHTLDDAEKALESHDKERAIARITIETNKPGFAVAPINSLRIGHQDSLDGLRLTRTYLQHLKSLPANERPDVLLVTDLVQGVFKHNQSQKRSSLAEGFQDANAQFRVAHELLKELKEVGSKIVVGMSENDHREAKDMAVDAVRELEELLKDAESNDFVHFGQLYKYSQNAMFQDFRKFALDYALPLSQKYGRRLRTADEMVTDTDGRISQSEFMHLYQHIKLGYGLNPKSGIDIDDVIELGSWGDDGSIIYTDDCDLVLRLDDGTEDVIKYRHANGLTTESLLSNHMINPQKAMGMIAMAAGSNDNLPTAFMTGQQQEAAMVTHSGIDIISNPGLTNPMGSLDTRQFHRRTNGDTSLRAFTTRRRAWEPGVYEYSRPAKGVVKYTIFDADVMERSRSIPRMAIITHNDWQVGSPTAHLDMILHTQALTQQYARRMPVAIHGEGDFSHGHIYPNMVREAQAIGLFDMDSQTEMVNGMIRDTWKEVPADDKQGVGHVLWLPGNHDEAQRIRFPNNHSRNIDTTLDTWREVLENSQVNPEESIVRTERVYQSDDGTPVPTWIGRPRYGDVNMAVAHYHINSKNYKGGSGGLAAYDPLKRLEGMGGFEDIQIASGAHHHNRQHTKVNGTWIDIGDANAAGQSEFESMLGMHHSGMSVKIREIGGGQPMTVTYVTEEALMQVPIEHGPYSPEQLADAGYFDDEGADPLKYGMYSLDGSPQTAEQKRLWVQQRRASQWANHMAEPLHNPRGQQNEVTRRMFAIAERLANA